MTTQPEQLLGNKLVKQLIAIINKATRQLLVNESELFIIGRGVHEQAISHRLAVLFEKEFSGYNVDCEYNKHLSDTKKFESDLEKTDCKCSDCRERKNSSDSNQKRFRPDIIIHRRGNGDHNLICIEIKKSEDCDYDIAKLKHLTSEEYRYQYSLGVFINFNNGKAPNIIFCNVG